MRDKRIIFEKSCFSPLVCVAIITFQLLVVSSWSQSFSGGTGTDTDPYLISTPADLVELSTYEASSGQYFVMTNNIDMSSIPNFIPVGNFQGDFDGNGKVVKNLTINRPTEDNIGLFGRTNYATIKSIGIENCNVVGQDNVGGLVGYSRNSIFSNCYVVGNITSIVNITFEIIGYVGGLIGDNYSSTISSCYTAGNVNGVGYAGGLVGYNVTNSTIFNCYTTSKVSGKYYAGGLVAYNANNSIISNCYSMGKVSGSGGSTIGGLVGFNREATIQNSVAANDTIISTNTSEVYRIIGDGIENANINNYALDSMVVINSYNSYSEGLNTPAGMGISIDSLQNLAFYTSVDNWYNEAWDIDSANAVWMICEDMWLPLLLWQGINCNFIPVISILDVPTTTEVGIPLTLTATVYPVYATNQSIVWNVSNMGTTGANLNNDILNTTAAGIITVTATITDGITMGTDYMQDFNILIVPAGFVSVTNITSVPTVATAGTPLTLSATVEPSNATNQNIVWTIKNAGTTDANINGNILNTTGAGSITVTATIANGATTGIDYTQDFPIIVSTVGISEMAKNTGLRIYPNPNTGLFVVESEQIEIKSVAIFDIAGKLQQSKIEKSEIGITIDISHLSNGLYFLKVDGKTVKVIKN